VRELGAGEAVPALSDRERLQSAVGGRDELEDAHVVGVDELGNPVAREGRLKRDDRRVDADLVEETHTCLQRVFVEPGRERPLAEDELAAVDPRRAAPPAKRGDELLEATGVGERQREAIGELEPPAGRSGTVRNPSDIDADGPRKHEVARHRASSRVGRTEARSRGRRRHPR
jgi:hypothetical protein